jgi:hypothetical protein
MVAVEGRPAVTGKLGSVHARHVVEEAVKGVGV